MRSLFTLFCSLFLFQAFSQGRIIFSDQPFGATASGGQSSFKSSQFIYGRLELNGATIKDAFKINKPNGYPYLQLSVTVSKDGEETGSEKGNTNFLLLKQEDLGRNYLNFDVLPDPTKASTTISMLDDFSAGLGIFPLYNLVTQSTFPSAGKYKVDVKLYNETKDGWGNSQDEEKWPAVTGSFDFQFDENDISSLQNNKMTVRDAVRENSFRYEKLPDIFFNSAKISDPKVAPARIMAILKRDLPNRTILKYAFDHSGGTIWNVAKDDYGLPKYRYFTPDVYVAYKMDGKCYVGTVTLREAYTGGGTFGTLEVGFTSASEQADKGIDCAKVK